MKYRNGVRYVSGNKNFFFFFSYFFFNDTATTEIYTLSLHDALPISIDGEPAVHISVRHLTLGVQKRKFKETENMSAVYDWAGSLSIHPESFTLSGCGLPKLKPSQLIIALNKLVLNMTETETTPDYPEEEINFLGYGPDSVCDDTVTESWIAVERMTVPETLPEVIMEGDSPRWAISLYFVPEQLNFKYFRISLKCL